ncbi:hypothetical protein [Sphingomonas sp. Leaf62]|uniref:hypothetical protein n=1 Tax=Sphingomonas sp. Leaf62 TaxID=1736228 RepID=UPI0006F26C5D|nr:hypothetical protein [Sphingomonas sp. Leaf62]KQN76168.1 hypothetical protein ASE91_16205 [Sphingomonas sp. Leaf62]
MLGFAFNIAASRGRRRATPAWRGATRDLIARMDPPPSFDRMVQIDRLIGALIDADIWSRLDTVLILAAHGPKAALLNWTGRRDAAIGGGAPVFVPDRGYWCDGLDDWIDTALSPVSGTQFQRNAAMVGAWTRKDARNPAAPIGTITGSSLLINPRNVGNASTGRLNGTTLVAGGTVETGYGFTAIDRSSSSRLRQIINGRVTGSTSSAPSTAPASATIGLGLTNDIYSEGQFCAFVAGGTLSDAQHQMLAAALASYMRDVGVNPLPAPTTRTLSSTQSIALPDGSAPIVAGSGMAVTGITRDLAGRWYLGNGRPTRTALLFTRMKPDLSAIDEEFDLTRLGLSSDFTGSCQGMTCDRTTGRIWFLLKQASSSGDKTYLASFDPATAALAGAPTLVLPGDNGIAFDSRRDGFWIVRDQNELILYDRQGRPRTGAIELPANSDHVFVVDAAQGDYAIGDIVVSFGANGAAGSLLRLRTGDYGGPNQIVIDVLTGAESVEGVHIHGNSLWIANDGATNSGNPARNRLLTYMP